jgi:hypothetical protein
MAVTEEKTGKFVIKRVKNKSNDNYRTIAFDGPGEDAKQVGSTFDEDIADKLAAYPEGADITLTLDKSGRFWNIVGARLADESDQKEAKSSKKAAASKQNAFGDRDLTYFMGNSARVIAAYVQSSSEYRDKIEDSQDPIEALHKDIVFGAKLLLNEANK